MIGVVLAGIALIGALSNSEPPRESAAQWCVLVGRVDATHDIIVCDRESKRRWEK